MKKLNLLLLVLFVCAALVPLKLSYSADIGVIADIPSNTPEITVEVRELTSAGQEPSTGTIVQEMRFGELSHILTTGADAGVWYSPKYYCAFIYASGWGNRYEIRSDCDGLVSGTLSLPAGSLMLTPGYAGGDRYIAADPASAQDTDDIPPGQLGPVARGITGIGAYNVIYTSDVAATNGILRAFYSIPGYTASGAAPYADWQPILLNQPGANYAGTVHITIAAI